MENIEISASVDAYKQFASFAKFSPLWRAPANEAVGLNPLRQYVTILQFYTLEDGSKIMLIWAQDLWCFKYAKKGDGIELTSLGWDSNPVMHLRPLTPDEIQKGNMAVNDKAVQNNLRQLFSAAQQYMLDKGVSSVSYAELIVNRADNFGSKTPIEGEDYTKLIFTSSQTEVIVELPDGREIKYSQ